MSKGIEEPQENWTRFPNCILDNLDQYTANELKVLAFIIRKTIGWQADPNYMFAAEYVAAKLDMSEKTARTSLDGLEQSGSITNTGRGGKAGVKLYKVNWVRPVKFTDRLRPVKITGDARQNLPAVLETNPKETSSGGWSLADKGLKPTKTTKEPKVKKARDFSSIEPVLAILHSEDPNAHKAISLNTQKMIEHEIEEHGVEYVCNAVRGRMYAVKGTGKPMMLTAFFDPDKAEWRADMAKLGERIFNAAESLKKPSEGISQEDQAAFDNLHRLMAEAN